MRAREGTRGHTRAHKGTRGHMSARPRGRASGRERSARVARGGRAARVGRACRALVRWSPRGSRLRAVRLHRHAHVCRAAGPRRGRKVATADSGAKEREREHEGGREEEREREARGFECAGRLRCEMAPSCSRRAAARVSLCGRDGAGGLEMPEVRMKCVGATAWRGGIVTTEWERERACRGLLRAEAAGVGVAQANHEPKIAAPRHPRRLPARIGPAGAGAGLLADGVY